MGLEEGNTANLVLPSGLITSYKPKMWHGGKVEVLHTLVSEDQNGEAIVQGGVSMDLKCFSDGGLEWSPSTWALVDVRGSSDKFIQFLVGFGRDPKIARSIYHSSSAFFRSLAQKGFDGLFSGWGTEKQQDGGEEEEEKEECNDYLQMNEMFSRVYTSTPVEFTVIDRGRRNSVVIQKNGFEELYMFSPGSDHNWNGKYAFVCVGPCALLKPIVLNPGGIWKGGQYLYNPNI